MSGTEPYLRNAWYVAAWSDEVGRSMLSRTLLDQPIVLYRKENGDAVAIGNACAHRFAPLHMGKLVGDVVQCPYHGLQYAADGKCVLNPHGDGMIPRRMAVPSYPLMERHRMIWLWMGDPEKADPATIPDFSCHEDPTMAMVSGVIEMNANYQLVTDNLLDLGHAEFVHEGVLSSDAITRSKLETIQKGTTLYANRWCPDGAPAPAWVPYFDGYDKPVDHWLYMRWDAPAHMLLDAGVTKVGDTRSKGAWVYGTDILTPKDKNTTYYFWAVTRAYRVNDPSAGEFWYSATRHAFEKQDQVIIEAQQVMLGDRSFEDTKPVMFSIDSGAQRARRLLEKLITDDAMPKPNNPSLMELRRASDETKAPIVPAV